MATNDIIGDIKGVSKNSEPSEVFSMKEGHIQVSTL